MIDSQYQSYAFISSLLKIQLTSAAKWNLHQTEITVVLYLIARNKNNIRNDILWYCNISSKVFLAKPLTRTIRKQIRIIIFYSNGQQFAIVLPIFSLRRTKNKVLIVRDKTIQKLVSCEIQIQKLEIHEDFHTGTRFSPSLQQQKIQKLVSHYL